MRSYANQARIALDTHLTHSKGKRILVFPFSVVTVFWCGSCRRYRLWYKELQVGEEYERAQNLMDLRVCFLMALRTLAVSKHRDFLNPNR
jgi:hypothetical protein